MVRDACRHQAEQSVKTCNSLGSTQLHGLTLVSIMHESIGRFAQQNWRFGAPATCIGVHACHQPRFALRPSNFRTSADQSSEYPETFAERQPLKLGCLNRKKKFHFPHNPSCLLTICNTFSSLSCNNCHVFGGARVKAAPCLGCADSRDAGGNWARVWEIRRAPRAELPWSPRPQS